MKKFFLSFIFANLALTQVVYSQCFDCYKRQVYEVYGELYISKNNLLAEKLIKALSERIYLEEIPVGGTDKYQNLASLSINNDFNADLAHEVNFDSKTFNPLKYRIDFFSNDRQVFVIYNTNYILIIDPVK